MIFVRPTMGQGSTYSFTPKVRQASGKGASNSIRSPVVGWVTASQRACRAMPLGNAPPAAVLQVADDRMAVLGQLEADLMLASRFQRHFQQGAARNLRQPPVREPGLLGPRHGRADDVHAAVSLVLGQPVDQIAGGRLDHSFGHAQ